MPIRNDRELQQLLSNLSEKQKRVLGVKFASAVLSLSDNSRLKAALSVALSDEASDQELNDAYRTSKSIAVETYTACGRDADWSAQAEHFVAEACTAALTPGAQMPSGADFVWKAAMQARMARNCAMIDEVVAPEVSEAQKQYQIAEATFG